MKNNWEYKGRISHVTLAYKDFSDFLKTLDANSFTNADQYFSRMRLVWGILKRNNFDAFDIAKRNHYHRFDRFNNVVTVCSRILEINLDDFKIKTTDLQKKYTSIFQRFD
jgi:hypothetical protein